MGTGTEAKLPAVALLCEADTPDTYCLVVLSDQESYYWHLGESWTKGVGREATEKSFDDIHQRLKSYYDKKFSYPMCLIPTCLL